jgi:hypothetical protein
MVRAVLMQPIEGGRHRGGNARWHPDNRGQVHSHIRTRRRERIGGSTGGETQPRAACHPHELKSKSLTELLKLLSFHWYLLP